MCGRRFSAKQGEKERGETFRNFSIKNRRNVVLLDGMIKRSVSAGYIGTERVVIWERNLR